jgi:proton glutamate symport protein
VNLAIQIHCSKRAFGGILPKKRRRIELHGGRYSKWTTLGSLAGLAAGLAVGLMAHGSGNSPLQRSVLALEPLATIWLNALQVIVFPLIVSVLLVSIASREGPERAGRMGGLTLCCYIAMLCLGALFSLAAASVLVGRFSIDQRALFLLPAAPESAARSATVVNHSAWQWLGSLAFSRLPRGSAEYILPFLATTILLAIVIRKLDAKRRARLVGFVKPVADASITALRWLFYALPVIVFVLMSSLYARTGSLIAKGIGYYILAVCGTLLAFTALQYAFAWLAARTAIPDFARCLWAAQATAVTTRSSLASLPPLLDGALKRLHLPPAVAAFVLPLSVSIFKASQSIYAPFKLIFLAHLFGVRLRPPALVAFVVGVFLLSFAAPGIPSGGSLHTIPLLLALGIPIQGIILFNSVEAIPDIFETLLNVTADMTVATMVARFLGHTARGDRADVSSAKESPTAFEEIAG